MPAPTPDQAAAFYECALGGLGLLVAHDRLRDPFDADAAASVGASAAPRSLPKLSSGSS